MEIRTERTAYVLMALTAAAYSGYFMQHFFAGFFPAWAAWGLAAIVAYSAHALAGPAIRELKGMQVGPAVLGFLSVGALCVYADLRGVHTESQQAYAPMLQAQREQAAALEGRLLAADSIRSANAGWRSARNGKEDWGMYATWKDAGQQAKTLQSGLDALRDRHEAEASGLRDLAQGRASDLQGGVVVSLVLLLVSAAGLTRKPDTELHATYTEVTRKPDTPDTDDTQPTRKPYTQPEPDTQADLATEDPAVQYPVNQVVHASDTQLHGADTEVHATDTQLHGSDTEVHATDTEVTRTRVVRLHAVHVCRCCGEELHDASGRRQFCSDACRYQHNNQRRRRKA